MPDTGIGYVYSRFIIHLGHKQRRFVDRIAVFELFGVEVGRIYLRTFKIFVRVVVKSSYDKVGFIAVSLLTFIVIAI